MASSQPVDRDGERRGDEEARAVDDRGPRAPAREREQHRRDGKARGRPNRRDLANQRFQVGRILVLCYPPAMGIRIRITAGDLSVSAELDDSDYEELRGLGYTGAEEQDG